MSQLRKIGELEEQNRKLIKDNEALKDKNENLKSRIVNMDSRNDALSWELHQAQKVNKVFVHEKERLRSYLDKLECKIDELGFWGLIKKAFKGLVK